MNAKRFLHLAVILLLLPLFAPAFAQDATPVSPPGGGYAVTDLGGSGSSTSTVNAVGEQGDLYGQHDGVAAIWTNGAWIDLGALSNEGLPANQFSMALGVNTFGQIVGLTRNSTYDSHAFRWDGSTIVLLPALPGHLHAEARAINANGLIVGSSTEEVGDWTMPVRWDGNQPVALDMPANAVNGRAFAINDAGQIAGSATVQGMPGTQAVFWGDNGFTLLAPLSGDVRGSAFAINAGGQIAGYSESAIGVRTATLWDQGVPVPLGAPDGYEQSVAAGINDDGLIVGRAFNGDNDSVAVLWDQDRIVVLASPANAVMSGARAINNAGVIGGQAVISTNWGEYEHGVAWTPASEMAATPDATSGFSPSPPVYYPSTIGRTRYDLLRTRGHGPAVNDAGKIVTTLMTPDGAYQAAIFDPAGAITFLGTLPESKESDAFGINATGQVVGQSSVMGSDLGRATFWDGTSIVDLGTLGGERSRAWDINAGGVIVGVAQTADDALHAFSWSDGVMTDLGTLPGDTSSYALGINDAGQIVGYSRAVDETLHAVSWENGQIKPLPEIPGDAQSMAIDINNAGEIVGWSGADDYGSHVAVSWAFGQVTPLGALEGQAGSQANAINDAGQIAGMAWSEKRQIRQLATIAVLWDRGNVVNLATSMSELQVSGATSINATGTVVGVGTLDFDQYAMQWSLEPPAATGAMGTPISPKWCYPAGGDMLQGLSIMLAGVFQERSMLLTPDLLIVPVQEGEPGLAALDQVTGVRRWMQPIDEASNGIQVASNTLNGMMFFTADGGDEASTVGAVDLADGHRVWTAVVAGSIPNRPVVADDAVYVTAHGQGVVAIDAATGAVKWTSTPDRQPGPIAIVNSTTLVVGLDAGVVAGYDRATGKELWRTTIAANATGAYDGWTWSASATGGIAVFAAMEGDLELSGSSLYGIDGATGTLLWTRPFNENLIGSPVVINDSVFISDVQGNVSAIDPQTGNDQWQVSGASSGPSWIGVGEIEQPGGSMLIVYGVGMENDALVGVVSAFNPDDGTLLLETAPAGLAIIDTPPALQAGLLLVRGLDSDLSALICAYELPELATPVAR